LPDRLLRATCGEQGCRKARKQPSAGEASARSFHRRVLVGSPPFHSPTSRTAGWFEGAISVRDQVGFRQLASGSIAASRDGGTGRRGGLKGRRAIYCKSK
jgi:hypothetical protein